MITIKFSHEYCKMPSALSSRKTYLLGLQKIHYNQLPENFILYDTVYHTVYQENTDLGELKQY